MFVLYSCVFVFNINAQSISADIFDPLTGGDYYNFSTNYPIEKKYATIDYRLFDSIVINKYITYSFDSIGRVMVIANNSFLGWDSTIFKYSGDKLIEELNFCPRSWTSDTTLSDGNKIIKRKTFHYSDDGSLDSINEYSNNILRNQYVFYRNNYEDTLKVKVETIHYDLTGHFDFNVFETFEIVSDRILKLQREESVRLYCYQGDSVLVLKVYKNKTDKITFGRSSEYRFDVSGKIQYENGYQYFYFKEGKLKRRISSAGILKFRYNRQGFPKKIIHKTGESRTIDRFNYYYKK